MKSSFKTGFCIYLHYICVILQFVWLSKLCSFSFHSLTLFNFPWKKWSCLCWFFLGTENKCLVSPPIKTHSAVQRNTRYRPTAIWAGGRPSGSNRLLFTHGQWRCHPHLQPCSPSTLSPSLPLSRSLSVTRAAVETWQTALCLAKEDLYLELDPVLFASILARTEGWVQGERKVIESPGTPLMYQDDGAG